ncbi:unnamed protein product, partial [Amoebophrya sp. A25]
SPPSASATQVGTAQGRKEPSFYLEGQGSALLGKIKIDETSKIAAVICLSS